MRKPVRKLSVFGGLAGLLLSTLYLGTAEASHVGCGTVITANTTLDSDIGPCSGDGIIIGADNITLNLNGHEIFGTPGPGDSNQVGIRLPMRSGVTVVGTLARSPEVADKGTVSGFDAGILVNGGSSNNIGNLVSRDNIGPLEFQTDLGDGILLISSSRNKIVNNLVVNNGIYDGIGLIGNSTFNRIQGNTIEDNNVVYTRFDVVLVNGDDGITLQEGASSNTVTGNTLRRNGRAGISGIGFGGLEVSSNRITGNVIEGTGTTVSVPEGLRLFGNPGAGITWFGAADGNLFEENVVTDNVLNGIEISSHRNRILNNVALGNGGTDLLDNTGGGGFGSPPDCDENIWFGNTYGTAFPDCAANGGEQVASDIAGGPEPQSSAAAARSPVEEELEQQPRRVGLL